MRYRLALTAWVCWALLVIPSGMAMGGPEDPVGWTIFAALLIIPVGIWWTKGTRIGAFCQSLSLALAAIPLAWFAYLAAIL